ncbi:MAG: hypothetical protein JWQ97_2308, partial [Phenylobacterium sp.]|nr:hypothetical protein [Phenylobacterium sp.]
VIEAVSEAPRHPNALCPTAGLRLSEIVGMPLNAASAAVMEVTDARQQCTHQIDLAGLAVAALAQRRPHRIYQVEVPDRVDGRTTATLKRDGELFLQWELQGPKIIAPEPYAGRDIGTGFTGFARGLPLDEAEAALVLRRAVFISGGRMIDLDAPGRTTGPMGGCWVWQPERAALATRIVGSTRDFTGRADELARDDQAWLAFAEEILP